MSNQNVNNKIMYRSCKYIERVHLNFNGLNGHQVNSDENGCIEFCCLSLAPGVTLSNIPEESIKNIMSKRSKIIAKSKTYEQHERDIYDEARNYILECEKCPYFRNMESNGDGLIHFVNINMYPAPCQSKCIYCGVHNSKSGIFNDELYAKAYENMFGAIEWARCNNMIAADAIWQVASGEITIHPYKDRIIELVKNEKVKFLTNCFIYDEQIAELLRKNKSSSINLSIDAGTAETWLKVKGVNNFTKVIENLSKYSEYAYCTEQITLKYIVLPGINDNVEDYKGIIDIMKRLKISKLIISRDDRFRVEKIIISQSRKINNKLPKRQYDNTDKAIACLAAMLEQNGMTAERGAFWPDEYESICERLVDK